jgi:hypothetical protein
VTTSHPSTEQLVDEPTPATTTAAAAPGPGTPGLPEAGLGPQITPWAIMAALLVAAGAIYLAQEATDADAQVAYGVAGVAFTAAVVAATVTRKKLKVTGKARHRLVAALYLGAAWLSTIAAVGLSWDMVTLLGLLGSGLSLLWWREHRIGPGIDPGVMPTLDDGDLYIERWAAHLGRKNKPYAGSRLSSPEIIKSGYRYTLHLVPGAQSVDQVIGATTTLRSGLQLLPGQEIIVEEHPTAPAPAALLTIVTRPVITKSQEWPGPAAGFDAATGSVCLGPFADGEGVACWRVYTQDSMWGGFIQGGTGSGKSRIIEQIALSCAASTSHPTILWYADGQNGDSSPMLVEHADYAATTFSEIYNQACAALRVMTINGVERRLARRAGFTPTPERPGLLLISDESHKPLSPKENPLLAAATLQIYCTIAREGRKNGVALIMASQSATLDAFGGTGGGNLGDTLRQSLLAGNGLILRSKTQNAKNVFNVDINPRKFPKLAGYGFLCDPDPGARSAPFRGYWVTDKLAAYWPTRITWRSLSNRQANAAGKVYHDRHKAAAEQRSNDEQLLAMADAGLLDFDLLAGRFGNPPAQSGAGQTPAGTAGTGSGEQAQFHGDAHPPVRRVVKFWAHPKPAPAQPQLPDGQQRVLNAIREGHRKPKDLIAVTGYSSSQIYNLLEELMSATPALIHKARYGAYEAGPAAEAA